MSIFSMTVPLLFLAIGVCAIVKQVDFYSAFLKGATEGLAVILRIFPTLLAMLTAIAMIRASGALEALASLPLVQRLPIPSELLPLVLVRPLSGSAALALGAELLTEHGADSLLGRTASVMLGSTETTFYTISLYFGACGISKTRYAIPAALCADITGFLLATWTVSFLFP